MQAQRGLGFTQPLQCARFELSNPFAAQAKGLTDLLERVLFFSGKPVAQAKDQLFARRERSDLGSDTGPHAIVVHTAVGLFRTLVRNEVFEALLGARNVGFERDRFA